MILAPLASLLLTLNPSLGFPHLQLSVLVAQASEASSSGDAVLLTRDGKRHEGKILSETKEGYLFHEDTGATVVIPFADIVDMNGPVSSTPAKSLAPSPGPSPNATAATSAGPASAKHEELTLKLKQLRDERDGMVSGTWALSFMLVGALDMILVNVLPCSNSADQCQSTWTAYMLFGGAAMVVGAGFGLYWMSASSDLDRQIAETKVEVDETAALPRQRVYLHYAWRF